MLANKNEFNVVGLTCKHSNDNYSLMLDISDLPVGLSSYCYKNCGSNGMLSTITISNLTPQDMMKIADCIKGQALKLLHEQEDKEANEALAEEIAQVYDDFKKVGI